jgi:hypothetical protein
MALRKRHRIFRGFGEILCRAWYANKEKEPLINHLFGIASRPSANFLNMTLFAGFLASSQGVRPARSRRKTQQRLPFDRKVEALRYLSKRVLQCPEFNLLAETLINA